MNFFKTTNDNQRRLTQLLKNIEQKPQPIGWKRVTTITVGGLTDISFSRITNQLLVKSHSGRSLIDCGSGEKLARNYQEDGDWYDPLNLTCQGIGPVAHEAITIAGLYGGGLPLVNQYGENIELTNENWPLNYLYFCPSGKSIFSENLQANCCRIFF